MKHGIFFYGSERCWSKKSWERGEQQNRGEYIISKELKYPKDMYTDCGLYDGDMDSEEISCYKEKLVKCRKPHKCNACDKDIPHRNSKC